MATLRLLGHASATASGSNANLNLVNAIIGEDGVGIGEIAANANGPIPSIPRDGTMRGLVITVDNRLGSADAYLIDPRLVPDSDDETAPIGAEVAPAGALAEWGVSTPLDLGTFDAIIRLLDGADVQVTVRHTGTSW